MNDSKIDLYVDYINKNVLSKINYARLHEDYQTEEKAYAKSVLNALHQGLLKVYGTDYFFWDGDEDSFILLPGVLKSMENGNLCLALLELDLSASGEHWGTYYLTKYGCVTSGDEEMPKTVQQFLRETYGIYDYAYTALLEQDIHVDRDCLPDDMKEILESFRNYAFVPCNAEEVSQNICDWTDEEEMER